MCTATTTTAAVAAVVLPLYVLLNTHPATSSGAAALYTPAPVAGHDNHLFFSLSSSAV